MIDLTVDNIISILPIIIIVVLVIFMILVLGTLKYGGMKKFSKPAPSTNEEKYYLYGRFLGREKESDRVTGDNEEIEELRKMRKKDPELYKDALEFYDEETRNKVEDIS